jgi:anion-transporting  ArsA/GET3 family ATPase
VAADLGTLVAERSILVACGTGGVGKTTMAAALAVEGARIGRRACVVTIDPAKRLADALGLESLTNTPRRIDGPWPGELWALMLDTKGTFDDLVHHYATHPDQAQAILENRLYRNISGALSGTQEYMAMEKLYELHRSDRFDLVVVDTPPTRNALDFLDAPSRLTSFLDNRIFRLVVMPTRAYLKAVSTATQTFLRTISRVVGADVVGDAIAFFEAFEGMEAGFRNRAQAVRELLTAPETGFVLVTSPRPEAVEEAAFFSGKLGEAGIVVDALVVNRLHPRFDGPGLSGPEGTALGRLRANLADFHRVAADEEANFSELADRLAPAPVSRVPFLATDVHDLGGLEVVADYLLGHRLG